MWEGIDIPGDPLSLLIIVRLPFPAPDPISQYERSLYPSMAAYKRAVVVPDMLIKLRQGFGRLIRLETDTGVAAFLDCRMSRRGAYHREVLSVLPPCSVAYSPEEVAAFLRKRKGAAYFNITTGSE